MRCTKQNYFIFGSKFLLFFVLVYVFAFAFPPAGLATTYYVATNGNDAYNGLYPVYQGGSNGPFRTLNRAAYRVRAGDTVQIRGGTYQEKIDWSSSGTSTNRITIMNYGGETVVIDGGYSLPSGSVFSFLVTVSGDFITLRDITIKRSSGSLLALSGDYSYAINVTGAGSRETGMVAGGNYNVFDGCSMTDNGNGHGLNGQTTWGSAICTVGNNTTIQNCVAYENRGEGINAYSNSVNAIIQDNVVYDNQSYNMYLDSAIGAIVRRNIVYQTKPGYLMFGIIIGGETGQPANLSIYNNLVMGCFVNFGVDSNVTSLSNVKVAYNTFVNAVGGIIDYDMGVYFRRNINTYANSFFKNNIIIEEDPDRVPISVESSHPGLTFANNCWNKTPITAARGTGDVIANPQLAKTGPTGAGSLTPGWFKIPESSPAKDQAQVLSEVTEDFFRTSRGAAPDMGAHEFSYGPPPLIATATGAPTTGQAPLTVNFTGGAGGGTPPYSYKWTFGDGGSSTARNPSHTYSTAGTFSVTLTITDSQGKTDSVSLAINVSAASIELTAAASATPASGQAPLAVVFSGTATGGAPPYSFAWNFGDGDTSFSEDPTHTYSAVGTYSAKLTVTDSLSTDANATVSIVVQDMSLAHLALSVQTGAPATGQGGTTDPPPGNHSFSFGSLVQAKSVPNPDYRFSRWDGDVFPASTFIADISITMDSNKSLSSTFCTECADVNGDLKITPADAQLAFDIYLKIIPNPTWCELENADVNSSGTKEAPEVTPADAQGIFNKFLQKGNINIICSGKKRSTALSTQNPTLSTDKLFVNQSAFVQNGDLFIPIIVDSGSEIGAFGLDLLFSSKQLTYIGLERADLTTDFDQLGANVISPLTPPHESASAMGYDSMLRIGGYKTRPSASPPSGVLTTLVFRMSGELQDASPISVQATYDDIQNVSIMDGLLRPQPDRPGRQPGKSHPADKKRPGRRIDSDNSHEAR